MCAILKTAQWALDNRKRHRGLAEFRDRLEANVEEMLTAIEDFAYVLRQYGPESRSPTLIECNAARSTPLQSSEDRDRKLTW